MGFRDENNSYVLCCFVCRSRAILLLMRSNSCYHYLCKCQCTAANVDDSDLLCISVSSSYMDCASSDSLANIHRRILC